MIRRPAIFLFLIFISFSCKKENALDCFKSNGPEITEPRDLGNFNTIEVTNKININIFKGSACKVEVVAGKKIIKNISTKVSDGILKIENNNTCNFVRGYKRTITVNITVPYLKFLKNDGVGTARFAGDFAQDTLVVRTESSGDIYVNGNFNQVRTSSHGNGDVYVNGTANSFYVYANGTNFVHAENLVVKDYAFIETLTIGDCFLNATALQEFVYNIGNQGNIYYKGNPPLIVDVGAGNVKGKAIKE